MTDIQTPWTDMRAPRDGALSTLRVGNEQLGSWYWIRCSGGRYGIAIQLPGREEETTSTIKGTAKINIVRVNDYNGDHYLGVVIGSSELATVFHRLCLDLMSSCSFSENSEEIVAILKRRVLAWQRLFEKGSRKLSPEQCLGLMAELKFLKDIWIGGASFNGVSGWVGPTGAAQDFRDETIELFVEVKSHPFESNVVKISSKEQLDTVGRLFLVAYPGCLCDEGDDSRTLNEYVEEVRCFVPHSQQAIFDELLLSTSYVKDYYYDAMHFKVGVPSVYKVEGGFPRLTGDNLSPAIGRVKYDIDLALAADWLCELKDVS